QELAEQLGRTAYENPPRPAVWRGEDQRGDEKPARRPDGNIRSGYDSERRGESAARDIGRKKESQVQDLRAVRPDVRHRLLLPNKRRRGPSTLVLHLMSRSLRVQPSTPTHARDLPAHFAN